MRGRPRSWALRRPYDSDVAVLALFAFLSLLLTLPLALHFTTALPGRTEDDPFLAWNLWWTKYSLLNLHTSPLSSDYIFYPIGINLAAFTLTTLSGLVSIPLQLAWGLIPANNVVVLSWIALAAFGTYLVVLDMLPAPSPQARAAAIVAGLVFGFASYRYSYLYRGQFNLNSNAWLPYYVLFLQRIFRQAPAPPREGILAAVFLVLAGWSESTFAAFLSLLTALYLLYALVFRRPTLFRKSTALNLLALAVFAVIGLAPLLLALLTDFAQYGDYLLKGSGAAELISGDLVSFFVPSQLNPILGGWAQSLDFQSMSYSFVGYLTLLLAVLAVWYPGRRDDFRFWLAAVPLLALVMLGPVLHIANRIVALPIPLPFQFLQLLPLVRANRSPLRYDHLMMLGVAILSGAGAFVVFERTKRRAWLPFVMCGLIVLEHLSLPLNVAAISVPSVYQSIAADPGDFSILELPLGWRSSLYTQGKIDYSAQFYQSVHNKRLIGGNTSRYPPFKFQYFNELPVVHSLIQLENGEQLSPAQEAQDRASAAELVRFFDLRYVLAQPDSASPAVIDYARRVFALSNLPSEGVQAFRVSPPLAGSLRIDPRQAIARLYFDDGWGRPETAADGATFRWATVSPARLFVPISGENYEMCGQYAGATDGENVLVRVNQVTVGELNLSTRWTEGCFEIPSTALVGHMATVEFDSNVVQARASPFPRARTIGGTGVQSPIDISATSGGFWAGKFASVALEGHERYATDRGYTLVALDPVTGDVVGSQLFDTFRDPSESARMASFVDGLAAGTIVVGAVCDEASLHLTEQGIEALRVLGVSGDLRGKFRGGQAFVGVKGAAPGTAVEAEGYDFPANVWVGMNITRPAIGLAVGLLLFDPLPTNK